MPTSRWNLMIALGLTLVLADENPARAECIVQGFEEHEHELDPDEIGVDVTPPGPLRGAEVSTIVTPADERPVLCGIDEVCPDLGRIVLSIDSAVDARTPSAMLGYSVELVSGALPAALPDVPVRLRGVGGHGDLHLEWSGDQEPFSAVLGLRAVDLAGNVGPELRIEVESPGASGCRVVSDDLGFGIFLVVVLGASRRRRRR